jgi:hypothetical protein
MRSLVLIGITLLVGASALIPTAHAQQLPGIEDISIAINPIYPRPYQSFVITPSSTTVDLISSTVTISVNGKTVVSGTGGVTGTAATGASGTKTTVLVTVVNNGHTYKKQMVIIPADVALVVDPLAATHPFYMGGGLVASEGRLRLIAIPEFHTGTGALISSDKLVYTWRLGQQILQSSSGIGRSTLLATAPVRYRDAPITVTVTTQDSSIVAEASTQVSPVDPIVRLYENDPLMGPLFDRALTGTLVMQGTEETLRMVPYYFSSAPTLSWTVNRTASGATQDITVRSGGSGTGTASVGATATLSGAFQSAETSLMVNFGQKKGLGIFGL